MKNIVTGAATAALMLAAAAGANAQSKKSATTSSHTAAAAAAPAASEPPLNHGPAIAGICFYSNNIAMGTSVVGKAMAERMQQLRAQAAAELSAEQTSLQNDEKALAAKRSTMSPDQFAQQAQPMGQREQALNQKADTRTRELQATYAHQQQRIGVVVEPIVRTIYEQRHCSVLLNGEAVMAGNPAMDLTEEVVKGLNAKMTTITFDRESAPAQ